MVTLNDYLYSGNTVLKILLQYSTDLKKLSKVDVNMFKAYNNQLINDGCGLFRGRQILPFEHLSRFQNDLIE